MVVKTDVSLSVCVYNFIHQSVKMNLPAMIPVSDWWRRYVRSVAD